MTAEAATGRRGWARVALILLVTLSVTLILVTAGILASITRSLAAKDDTLRELRAQQAQDVAAPVPSVSAAATPALALASLKAQFAKVQVADKNVDTQLAIWRRGQTGFGIIVRAVSACMYEADAYNRSATWFAASQLAGLPAEVDMKSAATDCGGSTFRKTAEKL